MPVIPEGASVPPAARWHCRPHSGAGCGFRHCRQTTAARNCGARRYRPNARPCTARRQQNEAACYQQFAVHDCLNQVRQVREAEIELRRQAGENEERREKAAERRPLHRGQHRNAEQNLRREKNRRRCAPRSAAMRQTLPQQAQTARRRATTPRRLQQAQTAEDALAQGAAHIGILPLRREAAKGA